MSSARPGMVSIVTVHDYKTRIHPRGGGAPFEKLELAFRNVLTQNTIGIFIGGVIVLHIVFFDEEYVKFSFRCQNIFSVQQHLYRSVI